MGKKEWRKVCAMKWICMILVILLFCTIWCLPGDRKVRVFDVNNGRVLEICNAGSGLSREIAEAAPDRSEHTFSTLQNELCCGSEQKDRSVIRVYDSNAVLLCTSTVPFPDSISLCPGGFAVCSGKIIFRTSKFAVEKQCWEGANELCVASLCDKTCATDIKRMIIPSEYYSRNWEESFMWSSSTSIVVLVGCEKPRWSEKVAIVDVESGEFRLLPYDVRTESSHYQSSFQGSVSRRYFSIVSARDEVIVFDGLGNVCVSMGVERLRALGFRERTESFVDMRNDMISICWDEGDVLWIFNANGRHVCVDVETNSIIKNGCVNLDHDEELVGLIQGKCAVIMQRRTPEFARDIWGNHFYLKDIETGNSIVKMPDNISRYTYLGNGLLLIEDL